MPGYVDLTGYAKLAVTVTRLNRGDGTADLSLTLQAPGALADLLRDAKTGKFVETRVAATFGGDPVYVSFFRRYRSRTYDLSLRLADIRTNDVRYVAFPLQEVFRPSGSTRTLRLPMIAQTQSFPGDWYVYSAEASLDVSNRLLLYARGYSTGPSLPVFLNISGGPALRGMSVRQTWAYPGDESPEVDLWVTTGLSTRIFAYLTASVALIVAFVALLAQLFAVRLGTSTQETGWVVALGMLAVLPIRQVVVPSQITSLTRLDLLLGVALVVSASALLLAFANRVAHSTGKALSPNS